MLTSVFFVCFFLLFFLFVFSNQGKISSCNMFIWITVRVYYKLTARKCWLEGTREKGATERDRKRKKGERM